MSPYWSAFGIALYLMPLAVLLVAGARPGREAWRAALTVPTFAAVDLVCVVFLSRVMTFGIATLVSRALWGGVGFLVLYRRRAVVAEWWRSTDLRTWINPCLTALCAVWLSSVISLKCALWDRWWHIPLVTALGGQRAPFLNFFAQNEPLAYHYAGDAMASMLQALSFAHIHSSYALSRMHDVQFGLIGLTLAFLLPSFGAKQLVSALAVTATTLLAGPATVLLQGDVRPLFGRSIINLLSLSYRPHVPVACLAILGFVGALLLPVVAPNAIRARETRATLFASVALLVLSDETSLAFLGVLLAAVWLCEPKALADTRSRGVVIGVGLVACIVTVVLLYGGTLGQGAVSTDVRLVRTFRIPGFLSASEPLTTLVGWRSFTADFFAILAVCAAGLMALLTMRQRPVMAMAVGYTVVSLLALLALTKVQIHGSDNENHRLATLPLVLAPLFGFYFAHLPGRQWAFEKSRTLAAFVVCIGLGLPTISTVEWLFGLGDSICRRDGDSNYADTDCTQFAGSRLGERSIAAYVDKTMWYEFAGCRPLKAESTSALHRVIHLGLPKSGWPRVRELAQWLGDGPLDFYCSKQKPDEVCDKVMHKVECSAKTTQVTHCRLSAQQREEVVPKS